MISRTQSKLSLEQLQTLCPQLQHQGKRRYTPEDLLLALHSLQQLCSLLQSSLPSESFKSILTSLEGCLQPSSKQVEDLLISLIKSSSSSQEDHQ